MSTFRTATIYIVTGALVGTLFGTLVGFFSDINLLPKIGELLGYALLAFNLLNLLILYYNVFKKDMTGKSKYLYLLMGCLLLGVIFGASAGYLWAPLNQERIMWMGLTGMVGADIGILGGILVLISNPFSQNDF